MQNVNFYFCLHSTLCLCVLKTTQLGKHLKPLLKKIMVLTAFLVALFFLIRINRSRVCNVTKPSVVEHLSKAFAIRIIRY